MKVRKGKKKRRWGVDKDESLENLRKEQKSKGARGAQKTQEAKKKSIAPFGLVTFHVTPIVTKTFFTHVIRSVLYFSDRFWTVSFT